LLAVSKWAGGVFATIVFSLSALMLNYILYRSKLIPRDGYQGGVLLEPYCI